MTVLVIASKRKGFKVVVFRDGKDSRILVTDDEVRELDIGQIKFNVPQE